MTARHRLNDLLGMRIRYADGSDGDQVTDVRLAAGERVPGPLAELVTEGLVVGRRRPGTLFGYDRDPRMGPWMIRVLMRRLHRHTGYVPWSDVAGIDWDDRRVRLRTTALRSLPQRR